jgi:hypothetical protein
MEGIIWSELELNMKLKDAKERREKAKKERRKDKMSTGSENL